MALSSAIGSLAQPAATGNQSVTGLSFQPKIVFFWLSQATADGTTVTDSSFAFGAATSSTDRHYGCGRNVDASTAFAAGQRQDNGHCIGVITADATAPVVLAEADFVSMNSDGFTINWTTADAVARILNYLALGGVDLTNVATGQFLRGTATGNLAVTGVGFQPSALLFAVHYYIAGTASMPVMISDSLDTQIGLAVSSTQRGISGAVNMNYTPTSTSSRYQRTAKAETEMGGGPSIEAEVDLVSMDSGGFTVNRSVVPTTDSTWFFYALKGGQYKVGNFLQKTSTGTQAITGLGFTPVALILMSVAQTAQTTIQNDGIFAMGAAVSASSRFCQGYTGQFGAATSVEKTQLDRTKVLKLFNNTPTLVAAADLSSFDADGFTLNWTTADATAREILYLAMGAAAFDPATMSWQSTLPIAPGLAVAGF